MQFILLRTFNFFEMAPNDFPDILKSMMCTFSSILSSLDCPITAFVAESKGYIKQALFKCVQKKKSPAAINHYHSEEGGHATKKTDSYNFLPHQNWSFKLLHVYFCDTVFCVPLIPSHNNECCRNHWDMFYILATTLCQHEKRNVLFIHSRVYQLKLLIRFFKAEASAMHIIPKQVKLSEGAVANFLHFPFGQTPHTQSLKKKEKKKKSLHSL